MEENSTVRRVIDLIVKAQFGQASDLECSELDALLGKSEALRVLYLDIVHLVAVLEDAAEHMDEPALGGLYDQSQIDREVLTELFEQALRDRRIGEIRAQAQSQLRADRLREEAEAWRPRPGRTKQAGTRVLVIPRAALYSMVAAMIALAAGLIFMNRPQPSNPRTAETAVQEPPTPDTTTPMPRVFAQIVERLDDRWASPVGDRRAGLVEGDYHLEAGYVRVRLNDGAEVVLQGPARFTLDSDNSMSLDIGKLVAEVPPSAVGFTVETPGARVVDIGTAFGVTAGLDSASTQIQVFDGEVRAAPKADDGVVGAFVQLYERQAIAIDSGGAPRRVPFDDRLYERDLYAIAVRPDLSGQATWLADPPSDVRSNRQPADNIQLFLERRGVVLEQDVLVDFNRDRGWPESGVRQHRVRAGQQVDVYCLHLDSFGAEVLNVIAQVDFGRPILGVIGDGKSLVATDGLLGNPGTRYPRDSRQDQDYMPRGIDVQNDDDRAWISRDGSTLHLDVGTSVYVDQLRVIVAAAPDPSELD